METEDYLMFVVALLGWGLAVVQFILNRKYRKEDKALEKRLEVYSRLMDQTDHISLAFRSRPGLNHGVPTDIMGTALEGDQSSVLKL